MHTSGPKLGTLLRNCRAEFQTIQPDIQAPPEFVFVLFWKLSLLQRAEGSPLAEPHGSKARRYNPWRIIFVLRWILLVIESRLSLAAGVFSVRGVAGRFNRRRDTDKRATAVAAAYCAAPNEQGDRESP